MKRLLFLLVALGTTNCRSFDSTEKQYQKAWDELQRGNLQEARRLTAAWPRAGDSIWSCKFRLLDAEILLAEGRAGQALSASSRPLPNRAELAPMEARRLRLQGESFLKLDKYEEAQKTLEEARQRASEIPDDELRVEIDTLEGLLLTVKNLVPEAAAVLHSALERANVLRIPQLQAAVLNQLAVNRIRAFRYDEALTYAVQAAYFASQAGAQRLHASALGNLGLSRARLGDFEQAHACLRQASAIWERTGNLNGLQAGLGVAGNIHLLEGDARKAIPYYRRALSIAQQLNAQSYASVWAANLASAAAEAGDWDTAEQLTGEARQRSFQETQTRISAKLTEAAIAAGRERYDKAESLYGQVIEAAPDNPEQLWEAHVGLANLYVDTNEPHQANRHFETAIGIIEKTRSKMLESEHKITFLSRLVRFYQNYVDVLVGQGEYAKAFRTVESSRARILEQRTGGKQLPPASAVSLFRCQAVAKRTNLCFLSYWVAPRRSFLWVITPSRARTLILPGEKEIASLVGLHQKSIQRLRDPLSFEQSASSRLSTILLGEASKTIPPRSRVILAADGPLHNLNFETLPRFDGRPHYWIDDVTLSTAASVGAVLERPRTGPRPFNSLLIMGDPEPAGTGYPRLPYAAEEVRLIEHRLTGLRKTVLTGDRATPEAYRQGRPDQFSVIHFAAHAMANPASPLDSAVILSPKAGNFLLYAREVAEQRLRAQLVTVAACRSAGARPYPGEGLLGLAWAFLEAGANNVIAGLWDVGDSSTAETMAALYSELAAGSEPAEALRFAKLALIRRSGRYRKPYYWGPFQHYIRVAHRP